MRQIYFDNAATTAPDPEVVELMARIQKENYGNPSSVHRLGALTRDIIEEARGEMASLLSIKSKELFFTSGATESINTILAGAVKSLNIKRIISSKIEHSAVLRSLEHLEKFFGIAVDYVSLDPLGKIDFEHLESLLKSDKKTLVALMHVNNELGNILPLNECAGLCQSYGALFFSDIVQSAGKIDLDLSDVDFAAGSAHKFHGPKGVGFMVVKSGNKIEPLLHGGPQEINMRAGTENVAAIAGMSRALALAVENSERRRQHISALKERLISGLQDVVPEAVINGDPKGIHTILNIGLPKEKYGKMLVFNLDMRGIAVSGGSACSSGVMKISHVIEALGLAEKIIPLRVSFSHHNTEVEVDELLNALGDMVRD